MNFYTVQLVQSIWTFTWVSSVSKYDANNGERYSKIHCPPRIVFSLGHEAAVLGWQCIRIEVVVICLWRPVIATIGRVIVYAAGIGYSELCNIVGQCSIHCNECNNFLGCEYDTVKGDQALVTICCKSKQYNSAQKFVSPNSIHTIFYYVFIPVTIGLL